jgi:hypothetical protein
MLYYIVYCNIVAYDVYLYDLYKIIHSYQERQLQQGNLQYELR